MFVFRPIRKMEKSDLALSCLSVCPSAWNKAAPTACASMKFDIR